MYIRARFEKIGYIRLIGHLDMMKLIIRAISRVGVKLKYSEGFNPSPKFSIANPLPLGAESKCEIVEFETLDDIDTDDFREKLSRQLPNGMVVKTILVKNFHIAATKEISFTDYCLILPDMDFKKISFATDKLSSMESYIVIREKHNKKRRKIEQIPIDICKSLIEIRNEDNKIFYKCKSTEGSTLRADMLIKALSEISGIFIDMTEVEIIRLEQYNERMEIIIE